MALSERQLANLWSKLDQLGPQIRAAEKDLADATAAGMTRRETATYRAVITRLKKERQAINDQLAANAKENKGGDAPPSNPPLKTSSRTVSAPTTGGTSMSLLENRAALAAAAAECDTALGQIAAVIGSIETALGSAARAAEGYDATDLIGALGLLSQSEQDATELQQQVAAAQQGLGEFIAKMS